MRQGTTTPESKLRVPARARPPRRRGRRAAPADAAGVPLRLGARDVHVWRAALDDQPDETMAHLSALLSPDEAERASRCYFERDRRRFIVARGVLRILLGGYLGCGPEKVTFHYGPNGKPAVVLPEGAEPLFFNLAHSDALALFAFTRAGEVGIDVERIRAIPDWESIAQLSFSPHELSRLHGCAPEQRRDEFFRAWTRQEAVLKALGTGLVEPGERGALREAAFCVHPLTPAEGYAASLAVSAAAQMPAVVFGWSSDAAPDLARAGAQPAGKSDFRLRTTLS